MVFMALLRMPQDYWPKFYAFDQEKPLLKSPTRSTATFVYNQEGKTPVRPSFKVSNNSGRKDPNKLKPVQIPPAGKQPKEFQSLWSKHGRVFADTNF
ncbi:unnamed protein product [Brugia timori]|nr:unnamed protein product [Brugia timori]